jgi:hypothetical protein
MDIYIDFFIIGDWLLVGPKTENLTGFRTEVHYFKGAGT